MFRVIQGYSKCVNIGLITQIALCYAFWSALIQCVPYVNGHLILGEEFDAVIKWHANLLLK